MTTPTYDTLRLEVEDAVAVVTLDRPDTLNLMTLDMRDELGDCFDHLRSRVDVRAVVVTGAGEAFSAGGDVKDFVGTSPEGMHDLMRRRSHRWFANLWSLPQPTIAAVNGIAAGGGANLVLACDLIVASERARFGETFVRLALVPDLGGAFLLPRVVGLHRAKELAFTGAVLDAEEARAMGLFTRVVPHDRLLDEAGALAAELARRPPHTISAAKALINRSFESSMDEVLQQELYAQSFLFATAAHREALDRFLGRSGDR
jgi:2-(1,2-epoxy-1,2-dihydrophenyl)acetyl-CoA isomerase